MNIFMLIRHIIQKKKFLLIGQIITGNSSVIQILLLCLFGLSVFVQCVLPASNIDQVADMCLLIVSRVFHRINDYCIYFFCGGEFLHYFNWTPVCLRFFF